MNATPRTRSTIVWTSLAAVAIPFLMGADGGGCSSGGPVVDGGPGRDVDAGTDASIACSASDCAGLAAPAIARLCPDGTSVAATVCVAQADGQCGWGFPECPADDAGSDAAITCSCPNMPVAPTCPDGSPRGFMRGPAPCQCEELAPCPASDGGGACAADTDCPTGSICGFPEADACAATGRCFAVPGAHCEVYEAGCACGGSEINLACTGLPDGYATKPLMHTGACEGGI
jgi:hypothetical protein